VHAVWYHCPLSFSSTKRADRVLGVEGIVRHQRSKLPSDFWTCLQGYFPNLSSYSGPKKLARAPLLMDSRVLIVLSDHRCTADTTFYCRLTCQMRRDIAARQHGCLPHYSNQTIRARLPVAGRGKWGSLGLKREMAHDEAHIKVANIMLMQSTYGWPGCSVVEIDARCSMHVQTVYMGTGTTDGIWVTLGLLLSCYLKSPNFI
jgi:hypothetical protein